ncbi:MAG: hypothetical protein IKZ34_04020 [Alphaproteobacteria bacterium]|nr:hypothetical protein [Alphaproteobacteria bacterium]
MVHDRAGRGRNISNLSGEPLYNAVHAQCSDMIADSCPDASTKTMVITAYGMYIENDCSMLISALDKKLVSANALIRDTEYTMGDLRLENYNAHNSTSINDCIANVRRDITKDTACGKDYVHCLDVTGRYLHFETGEPIYSAAFFQLDSQTSLSGDLLTNQTNRLLLDKLERMRGYATNSLDKCREVSSNVWDEFLRQAITEIHQQQQEKIRKVKNECLDVVNKCYDEQNKSLKDFSNTDEALLLGARLELSEAMCQEKMDTCSNLYGGGTEGLQELLVAMYDIIEQQIAQQCLSTLQKYTKELCNVPGTDTLHTYPYGCRVYNPGTQEYALDCKKVANKSNIVSTKNTRYTTSCAKNYTSCNTGYYFVPPTQYTSQSTQQNIPPVTTRVGLQQAVIQFVTPKISPYGQCIECPEGYYCPGGDATLADATPLNCPIDYTNSLYYKLVSYATDVCIRPSQRDNPLPHTVLQDINTVMDSVRADMAKELAKECERLGGTWVSTAYNSNDNINLLQKYINETSANTNWGYCKQ